MKKSILLAVMLIASISFTSCTDLNNDDESIYEIRSEFVDPEETGEPEKEEDPCEDC
jgi:hypothetical protein